MAIHKHKKKTKGPHKRRNAAPVAALPRAVVVRRKPTVSEQLEAERERQHEDSRGRRLASGIGGALLTSALGIALEHQSALSVPLLTAGLTAGGVALALGAPNKTARAVGVGAAAAGTTLLSTLADRAWFSRDSKADEHPQVASSSGTAKPVPGKKPSNATDIPADALARAYERARLRMALASEPTN